MKHILIVEDSNTVTKVIKHLVGREPDIRADYAGSMSEAKLKYDQLKDKLIAVIADLNLPDAPNGEVVDFFLQNKLPVIVLTANYQEEKREALLNKGIVDYVIKESRYSYQHALTLINRLEKNRLIKVLVAEDSNTTRAHIRNLLKLHRYQVLEARDGLEALEVIKQHSDIKLLITDYHMPEMDGFELVKTIRGSIEKSDLVIIGLSAEGQGTVSARFIKNGANDFLSKPFQPEEFFCRITQNIEALELFAQIRDAALRDSMTKLYTRSTFLSRAEPFFEQAKRDNKPLALALLSIDNLKAINDRHGEHSGDQAIYMLGEELQRGFSRFLIGRLSGNEFAVLLPGVNNEQATTLFDRFRTIIAALYVQTESDEIAITFSTGISNWIAGCFTQQLRHADRLKQRAHQAGGDFVIGEETPEAE
jgi:diguanylate cyclase (GGDEF)-like protein